MRQSTGKYINKLSDFLEQAENIAVVCHTNPDGDAIGSMMAMYHYLLDKGKKPEMVSPSDLPDFLKWLNKSSEIFVYDSNSEKVADVLAGADLHILVDFNSMSRTGSLETELNRQEKPRILIDHHPQPDVKADYIISEPAFSSTAELIYDLVSHLEKDSYRNPDFIEAVYTGMMTDTGNFSFGTYDGETMRIVGALLENGLRKDYITDMVYDNFSAGRMRLKGFALAERMVVMEDISTAYIYLSRDDMNRFNHAVGDTEGFVNMPLSIAGIKISVLFLEKDDHLKLSLRSKGDFSVNDLARKYFNGGGHLNAAGGRLEMPLHDGIKYFESIIRKEVNK
ncbi:MAG: bifunctional oligoribonuclease/PAP phosphatase NrnA [Marinilabiliaceae bacterium]|jgi:phosphoesterase RecJ-like protein|nr:bifunctional oligoribonuclease/PAP phosphatase NrnA [Marinilabiliaceae bacterium]